MTPEQERQFEIKAEKMLAGQRELPNGRNFLCFSLRFKDENDMKNYRENFDTVFPNAPGAGI